jgi:hypothetical protein
VALPCCVYRVGFQLTASVVDGCPGIHAGFILREGSIRRGGSVGAGSVRFLLLKFSPFRAVPYDPLQSFFSLRLCVQKFSPPVYNITHLLLICNNFLIFFTPSVRFQLLVVMSTSPPLACQLPAPIASPAKFSRFPRTRPGNN